MAALIEAYFDGAVDLKVDFMELLAKRDDVVNYQFTPDHVKFFLTRFIPEVAIHSKKQDERIVRDHYDRGNDFFNAFLGPRMVYTCGFFKSGDESLELAQDNKLNLVCDKLQLKPGERLLDIGCGGALAMHAAKHFGADATGVTIAQHQTSYGNNQIAENGVKDNARILCLDYRDIPRQKFDKISCLEMAEHVGVKNFSKYLNQVSELLHDDGLFLLQIAGLRKASQPEDLIWGLFMNKYIFSGADASMPLGWVINKLEKARFEVHSVETIGIHYSHTIARWYKNWMSNREKVVSKYGERWFRIWEVFLGWSTIIAAQGSSTCFQIVSHKNLNAFDRTRFFTRPGLGEQTEAYASPEWPSQKVPTRTPVQAKKANGKGETASA
jgi:cyclopropane fatty-acyl-phospholipid synthase-like methyltransferase